MLVHYGWIGSPVPESAQAVVDRARRVAAGCEVMFHTDESVVPERWRESLDRFKIPPLMRSDILRHAVLQQYGGLWLDTDVRLLVDPAVWAADWNRYTAVRLHDVAPMIGTDVIYVPSGWGGWNMVESYIDGFFGSLAASKQVDILVVAHWMIHNLSQRAPHLFSILRPGGRFPHANAPLTTESVVARGFDPDVRPVRQPPPPRMTAAPAPEADAKGGPGTELSAILKNWLGIEPSSTCKCKAMARKMDRLGADWCEGQTGMTEILMVMRTEHAKRWSDGRTKIPWSDYAATQLVRLACRRARLNT